MTATFLSRLQVIVSVAAVVGLLIAAGLVAPATAGAASGAQCSIQRAGAGDPAALRVQCAVPKLPSGKRTLGTAIPRGGETCTIKHLGALDPAALRLVC